MNKAKVLLIIFISFQFFLVGCTTQKQETDEPIQAFSIDFNWGEGGPNAFAKPGLWADASPEEHIQWYKDMGVNTIQTFIVSCNGYAWYKNGVVPEQPGLKHDFLPEMVRLGHKEGMKVMGYFCIGSNTRWGLENPEYSYGIPTDRHIPYTKKYLGYLDEVIRDAVKNTGIDGFMIDWFYQPNRSSTNGKWLDCEKQRYEELMGKQFPGEDKLSEKDYDTYSRLAISACWDVIYKAAKETNPDCIIWLTSFDITHPHIVNSKMFQQIDWLMNEAGDIEGVEAVRNMVGEKTRLITCLANWNKQDPMVIVPKAIKAGVGLYGFAKPEENSLLPSIEKYLEAPVDSLKGDDKNIAILARIFNGYSMSYKTHQLIKTDTMHRYGQIIKLKPERVEEYKKLHAEVWPDVTKAIAKSNLKNYSIYLKDEILFAYFEYHGNQFEKDMAEMAANPVIQKWWDVCKPCMLPIETRQEGEWWANMEEIFHQD